MAGSASIAGTHEHDLNRPQPDLLLGFKDLLAIGTKKNSFAKRQVMLHVLLLLSLFFSHFLTLFCFSCPFKKV